MDYAEDGDLSGLENAEIAQTACWDGDPTAFVDALLNAGQPNKVGFLEKSANGHLVIHDWDEYAGVLIDRRRRNAQYKRDIRRTSEGHPKDVSKMSGAIVEKSRLEKTRVEPLTPTPSPPSKPQKRVLRVIDLKGDIKFLATLKAKFPNQDIDLALVACDDHWGDRVKAPRKAFINWLQKAEDFRKEKPAGAGAGAGQGSAGKQYKRDFSQIINRTGGRIPLEDGPFSHEAPP